MTRITKRCAGLLASLTAAAALFTCMPFTALTASARTEQTLVGYYGDVNLDQQVNIIDVQALAAFLTQPETMLQPQDWTLADLNEDSVLDAQDLTLLKRMLLEQKEPRPFYQETELPDPELIPPPILAVNPTLGSVGEQKIFMVSVEFPDCKNERDYSVDDIFRMVFGSESGDRSRAYPLESITAFYDRSSYGRLHLTGDVRKYTAKNNLSTYAKNSDSLVEEILGAMDEEVNYQDYDGNGDGVLDTFLMALPPAANPNMDYDSPWWPCSYDYGGRKRFDRIKAGNICMGAWSLDDRSGFNCTWVHELGHAMGLPDYYYYENPIGNGDGLPGEAGFAMMDEAMGDMTAFDKLMYGWYTTDEVQVYAGGTQTFTLASSQEAPGCIIIPRGDLNGYLSEYFILEYVTDTGNNYRGFSGNFVYDMFDDGGVRILHCDSEVCEGWWGPELKWNNYGYYYDRSNLKQRVLRIVDEENGFFKAGSSVDCSRAGFQWYDNTGYQSVDPGITVEVTEISDGRCTVTIREGSNGTVPNTQKQTVSTNDPGTSPWSGWGGWGDIGGWGSWG